MLRFAVFTALGLALAGAAIVGVVRDETTSRSLESANERAIFATDAVLERELRATDLRSPQPARRRDLGRMLRTSVLREGIVQVTLHDARGRTTYSTGVAPARIPEQHLRASLAGTAVSDVAEGDGGRVLRTYVPIALAGEAGTARGVVVFEQDYSPIAAAIRHSTWFIAGVLEALLLLLFLVLAPILARVTSRIRGHMAELEHVATHDELTGAANRLGLRRAVEERLSSGTGGSLLLLDADGFSEVNEVFGSDAGDALLREVALRLRGALAGCAVFARVGDDEFAALLDDTSVSGIGAVAQQAGLCLEPPIVVDGVPVAVTLSWGAAVLGGGNTDFATALQQAGTALAAGKAAEGRGIYESRHEAADASSIALTAELRDALTAGELLLHYQPQEDLLTRRIRGVEALLRWQHPTRGLLPAHEFIRAAERSGLATELRRFVLASATAQWHKWHSTGIELELSVNLSAIDLHDVSLPDEIGLLLDRHGMPPRSLVVEITERTLGDEARTREVVERLKALGVRLAIDDFGTEYASLASLRRFPPHVVKLDRSLLAGVPGEPTAQAIVGGSVALAHALGAIVVAEGVETSEQWKFVNVIGCDVAQGYLVGRPGPADAISELLLEAPAVTPHIVAA